MDPGLLKTCHREIGHIVFDANEKVTTRRISNNWNIDCQKSMEVLQKWIEDQKDTAKLSVEYVIRGVDKNGNVFMSVVKEEKLHKICKLYPKCVKMLYSVEVSSEIRPTNVSIDSEFSVINLRIEPQKRKPHQPSSSAATVPSQPAVQVKQEQKKIPKTNLFATVSKPSVAVKEEKKSSPATPVVAKVEPQITPPAKVSPKKLSPKKETKKVANGKGSISSFFSSKPAGQATAPKATSTGGGTTVKQEPESPTPTTKTRSPPSETESKPVAVPQASKTQEKTRKRTITDDERSDDEQDVIPSTPKEEKRDTKKRTGKPGMKRKKSANPSKRSRIMEICDSSSDDEMDGREAAEQRKERLVDFDEEMPEPQDTEKPKAPSPEKPVENDSNSANRKSGKVKKMVTKTFTDEEGYLITVKEWEMVSEDESQQNGTDKEASATPAEKAKPALGSQAKSASVEKKASPPTPKTKQGSIMSFFAKK